MARLELLEFARDFSKENDKSLTKDQEEFLKKFSLFLEDKEQRIFILRGYAGTGKTYLVSILTHFFKEKEQEFHIATPTGRAAKVVNDKIGENKASTIHSLIYAEPFIYDDDEEDKFKLIFPLYPSEWKEDSNILFIFDEASMISNVCAKEEDNHLCFGSGKLLTDILEFTLKQGKNKILFIGDDEQLPPINGEKSPALEDKTKGIKRAIEQFIKDNENNENKAETKKVLKEIMDNISKQQTIDELKERGFSQEAIDKAESEIKIISQEVALTEITRQKDKDNVIIKAGQFLRDNKNIVLEQFRAKFYNEKHFFTLSQSEAIKEFVSVFQKDKKNVRYIVWKNEQATETAKKIRAELKYKEPLEVGDELLVMRNTIQEDIYLCNGDFIEVLELGKKEEEPVSFNVRGEKEPRKIILSFIDAKIKTEKGEEIEVKLLYDYFLYASGKGNRKRKDESGEALDPLYNYKKEKAYAITEQALYVEFKKRMREEIRALNLNKEEEKEALAQKMKENLRTDKYYNALRVKFAYAITCHKAQGGEWDRVFIDISELDKNEEKKKKWLYTAITRARKTCVFVRD